MKHCPACDLDKPTSAFGTNTSKKDGLQAQCKECRKTTNQRYYQSSKDEQNPKRAATRQLLLATNSALMVEYLLEHPCVDCGNSDIRVLEFDHITNDKSFNISRRWREVSWDAVLLEIQKCEVRCANCHRIVTGQRAGWYKSLYMGL